MLGIILQNKLSKTGIYVDQSHFTIREAVRLANGNVGQVQVLYVDLIKRIYRKFPEAKNIESIKDDMVEVTILDLFESENLNSQEDFKEYLDNLWLSQKKAKTEEYPTDNKVDTMEYWLDLKYNQEYIQEVYEIIDSVVEINTLNIKNIRNKVLLRMSETIVFINECKDKTTPVICKICISKTHGKVTLLEEEDGVFVEKAVFDDDYSTAEFENTFKLILNKYKLKFFTSQNIVAVSIDEHKEYDSLPASYFKSFNLKLKKQDVEVVGRPLHKINKTTTHKTNYRCIIGNTFVTITNYIDAPVFHVQVDGCSLKYFKTLREFEDFLCSLDKIYNNKKSLFRMLKSTSKFGGR